MTGQSAPQAPTPAGTAPARPVRPRDAASLVLLRAGDGEPQVLMGRRHSRHAFIPDAFVFPGGKLDPDDRRVRPARPLAGPVPHAAAPAQLQALAVAAVRETYEETGLMLARPGDPALARGTWADFARRGVAPDLGPLRLLARAITPAQSPIRFHARFFLGDGSHAQGRLRGSGELLDLDWYPLSTALTLPVIDVTEFVLGEIRRRAAARHLDGPVAFWRYRRETPVLSYEPAPSEPVLSEPGPDEPAPSARESAR